MKSRIILKPQVKGPQFDRTLESVSTEGAIYLENLSGKKTEHK